MNLLCPGCHTPLPAEPTGAVTCTTCALEVDLSRQDTVAGKPRFLPERSFEGISLPGFAVKERIGAGGMGSVYAAEDAKGQRVAIKFLASWLAGDSGVRARFAREIQVMRSLTHPGILGVLAEGDWQGVPWFAMPFVAGPSLKQRLASGPLLWPEAMNLFSPLLEALAHAHDKGIVHRDLKPANILLGSGGPMLADFGIAQLAPVAQGLTALTHSSAVVGTLPYMSPEQREGEPLDKRSDLYAFGVIAYEVLCGRLPQGAFALPSRLAKVPRGFDQVISKLLAPMASDRFQNAREVKSALARLSAHRRARIAWASASAGLILLAGGAVITFVPNSRQSTANKEAITESPPATIKLEPTAPPPLIEPAPLAPPNLEDKVALTKNVSLAKSAVKAPPKPAPAPQQRTVMRKSFKAEGGDAKLGLP